MLCQVPFAQEKIARPHRVFAHGEAFLLQIADGALQCKQNAPVETLLCRRPDGIHAGVRAVRLDHIRKIDDFLQCRHIGFSGRVIRNRAANCLAFAEQRSRNRRACFGLQKLPVLPFKIRQPDLVFFRQQQLLRSGQRFGYIVQNPGSGSKRLVGSELPRHLPRRFAHAMACAARVFL